MKRLSAILVVTVLAALFLCGCGNNYYTDESTVFVLKNGKIVSTDVEEFTDTYNQSDLEEYIEGAVSDYNASNGDKSVKLKKLAVKDGKASLTLEYKDYESYAKFNGIDFFEGTIAEALAAGYDFAQDFAMIEGDNITACDTDQVLGTSGYKVVVIKNNVDVKLSGQIKYASINNTKLLDDKTICIKSGNNLLNSVEADTENLSEVATEMINSEADTEVVEVLDENQGSVGEDELLSAEAESEKPLFVFEDEVEADSNYTNVYTYVIFK